MNVYEVTEYNLLSLVVVRLEPPPMHPALQ